MGKGASWSWQVCACACVCDTWYSYNSFTLTYLSPPRAGLSREPPSQQVQSALALGQALLEYTAAQEVSPDVGIRVALSIGVHSCAAQVRGRGVVAGAVLVFSQVVPHTYHVLMLKSSRHMSLHNQTVFAGPHPGRQPPRHDLHWAAAGPRIAAGGHVPARLHARQQARV